MKADVTSFYPKKCDQLYPPPFIFSRATLSSLYQIQCVRLYCYRESIRYPRVHASKQKHVQNLQQAASKSSSLAYSSM